MNKVLNFISENNIEPSSLFQLVEKVQTMDLSSDESIRKVVRDVSRLANRPISQQQENKIVQEIMNNGINDNLFNMI